eukprot:569773_1
MKSEQQCKRLLLWITIANVYIIDGWKCALYLYTSGNLKGGEYGPFDVGQVAYNTGPFPNDDIDSFQLDSAGYTCTVDMYRTEYYGTCSSSIYFLTAQPHSSVSANLGWINELACAIVRGYATPNPTPAPSGVTFPPSWPPTNAPSTSPTSSCSDYNNETSADGNDEIRQFDDKHITNIDNYFIKDTFVLEFDSSNDQYKQQLIECTGYDCVVHCNHSASCLETQIQINVQNKT